MKRISFLGYPVDSLDTSDALAWMEDAIQERTPRRISVINANKLWQMSHDGRLEQIIRDSDLVLPEFAVYWGASKLGTPLKSYVAGVVLLKQSLPWAEKKGIRIFFLGAKPEIIQALTLKLHQAYPGLIVAGAHHGYLTTPEINNEACEMIRQSQADILYVAMGSPRQEYWIDENQADLGVPVAMGVGGSFDVLAGLKKDTPDWARGHGWEWFYRLSQEPRAYWKRYLITNPWFVWQIVRQFLKRSMIPNP